MHCLLTHGRKSTGEGKGRKGFGGPGLLSTGYFSIFLKRDLTTDEVWFLLSLRASPPALTTPSPRPPPGEAGSSPAPSPAGGGADDA